jgi:hypothetical protein
MIVIHSNSYQLVKSLHINKTVIGWKRGLQRKRHRLYKATILKAVELLEAYNKVSTAN